MIYNATRPKLWLAGAVALLSAIVATGLLLMRVETTGTSWGPSARLGPTIATLILRQEPYIPSLHRDPSKDRFELSLLLHDAGDPSVRRLVRLAREQPASGLNLSRITGAGEGRIRFQVPEDGAYEIDTGRLIEAAELHGGAANARAPRAMSPMDLATGERALQLMLSAAGFLDASHFIAVLSPSEIASSWRVGLSVPRGFELERGREPRSLHLGEVERQGSRLPLLRLAPASDEALHDAAFVRTVRGGDALRLADGGLLLVHATKPRGQGVWMAAHVDAQGRIGWRADTGIGELQEVLPDPARPAFVGTRPNVPGRVPEPILVILDAASGSLVSHSLWVGGGSG